ncbi:MULTISPECIES: hypothetical protein [Pseudothermotoga]|jgi:tRNA G18 (ribose-2'-O)-methylase SpoU|uniref:DRTGG domain-containing protein n=1 Tax=Pseudothermotoga lettingae (strain ATCC BAA-301 / DSM 14385 / NBRC 107922 / TMO) TaxID=416591 RepID=A8F7Q6_PSELT|nr:MULTISPECIES: hypothetical protein [Pseudothermotoga]ABV34190.1 conserved hypothetical protein [Pseudothermotoga lettingae TMO]KUK21407.1 MAG: Uncharacterized protein XD56_0667 [Pseudothermotoga lettingae]MDI3494462.1 hypothetical protein [Pseudothermotoga sp.]MDK2884796.1 hypothetical protein [Pseudothermotoga sp.]GLI48866.1 hypothetical protein PLETTINGATMO_10350 [Pseudothermotoga lettingae TMO]
MKLSEILSELKARVITGEEMIDELDFEYVTVSDLMSDILALARPNMVLLTGLTTPQVVRTADVVGIKAVIIVRRDRLPDETIEMAKLSNIVLAITKMTMFEACGRLYSRGLKPIWEV